MHMTLLMVAGHWLRKCYITSFSVQGIWGWFQKASHVNKYTECNAEVVDNPS